MGFQLDLWYNVGIGYPAFKAVQKGINSNHQKLPLKSIIISNRQFGSKEDNYPYFNDLITNLGKVYDLSPFLVVIL